MEAPRSICQKCLHESGVPWQFCPKCGSRDSGVEAEHGWHRISRLFAHREDYDTRSGSTFAQWFFSGGPDLYARWLDIKNRLAHPEKIPWPGGASGKVSTARAEFLKFAGVGKVTLESFSDIVGTNFMKANPFLMKLCDEYVKHWQGHFARLRDG